MKKHLILFAFAAILAGCSKEKGPGGAAAGGPPKMEMQVVTAEAKRQSISDKISLVGSLLANESVEIKSEIDGTVLQINFEEGQRVDKGRLLVALDDSKLAAELAAAEADFNLSKTTYERNQQLLREKLISKQEFDQASSIFQMREADLQLRRRLLKDTRIVAPFAGVVGARNFSEGQVISRNATLTWLTDLETLKVEINIPERFIGQLKLKQPISLRVVAYPKKEFQGEVYFIAQHVDAATRTVVVKAKLANPEGQLRPGMFANLDLTVDVRENAIVIPETALARVFDDSRAMLFIVDQQNVVEMRNVKLGLRMKGQVEIIEGLNGGETVVIEGLQKIGPGSAVKAVQQTNTQTQATGKV